MKERFFHKQDFNTSLKIFFGALLCLALLLGACTPRPKTYLEPQDTSFNEYYEHRVTYSGETLGIMARWYTGDVRNWILILDNNPGLDEKRIRIGDYIRIPKHLMVRDDFLPESVVLAHRAQVEQLPTADTSGELIENQAADTLPTGTLPSDTPREPSALEKALGVLRGGGTTTTTREAIKPDDTPPGETPKEVTKEKSRDQILQELTHEEY